VIYEDAARRALQGLREELGVSSIETRQLLERNSGASWEINARAWRGESEQFLVVEARRHTSSRLKQEDIAAVAFRVEVVGAAGGIVISPLPLRRGARLIAQAKNIAHVRLSAESTPELYVAAYMGRPYHGVSIAEGLQISVTPRDGYLGAPDDDP
jgi:hypothetical protein